MDNRFEGKEPDVVDMLWAYEQLGLTMALGEPGLHTAFCVGEISDESMVFHVIPGDFSSDELIELLGVANGGIPLGTPVNA